MNNKHFYILLLTLFAIFFAGCSKKNEHPRIYISNNEKKSFTEKVQNNEWAQQSFDAIKAGVEKYVDKHTTDPEWIISRMQMYWDNRYEKIYVDGDFFSHGTGTAPVPTVKFAGARDWAIDYVMPSLEDTKPYMDKEGMYLQNIKKEGHPWEWVHPSKTGRLIGPMNDRIMSLAANAAFLYWFTGEEKYAVFAKDIFMTYIKGIHYRREPFAIKNYGNGHILGLTTFEVIIESIIPPMSICYDFLYNYLKNNGEDINMVQTVFKRFTDQQIANGVPDNNWNIFQARHVAYLALALEDNDHYTDKKGRQYYLNEIFNETTVRQFALKETIEHFDPESGLWAESAGYSMSVCNDFLDILCLVENAENNNILDTFPILKKAVPATVQYLFPNGRTTAFGDAKYGHLKPEPLEKLISLYRKYGDTEKEKELTKVLYRMTKDGHYKRNQSGLFSLFNYVDKLMDIEEDEIGYEHLQSNLIYTPNVSWTMLRNGTDPYHGMATTLVGSAGNHAHANGISMELFAKGLILFPESSYGESYGTIDNQEYYARFPAHNTVMVDGQSDYAIMYSYHPYTFKGGYPSSGDLSSMVGNVTYVTASLNEPKTDALQERTTSIIRTGESSGYFVDVFRSHRRDGNDKKHEYLLHSIGQSIDIMNTSNNILNLTPTTELSSNKGDHKGYDYFFDKKGMRFNDNFKARFNVKLDSLDNVYLNMWMKGYPDREIFSVKSPKSRAFEKGYLPDELYGQPLSTLVVRQNKEAWNRPFVAIYEPYSENEKSNIMSINYFGESDNYVGIAVNSVNDRSDYIFSTDSLVNKGAYRDMQFEADYAVISQVNNSVETLFIGNGNYLKKDKWEIRLDAPKGNMSLYKKTDHYELYCNENVKLSMPFTSVEVIDITNGEKLNMDYTKGENQTISFSLPAGKYRLKLN